MTWVYETLEGRDKLIWAKSELRYELTEGVHTFHMCKCGRKGCRANMCVLCWEEEIDILRVRLNERKMLK